MKFKAGDTVRVVAGNREKSHDYAGMSGVVADTDVSCKWPYGVEFVVGEPTADDTGVDYEIFSESELEADDGAEPGV